MHESNSSRSPETNQEASSREDMFSLINEKGPSTDGIFRLSTNMSACHALKDKLDSGTKVNMNKEDVHVVASVLKEFLRSIQGSVLTSRLYDIWLGVLDQRNEEEKLAAVQRFPL